MLDPILIEGKIMRNTDQKGFSALDIILSVALVAVIGVAGYFAYQNAQNKTNSNTAPKSSVSPSSTPTPSPTLATEFLVLSDWGITFKVPATLKVADIYHYKTHVAEGPEYYGFTTNRVRAQGGLCDNEVSGNLSTLTRFAAKSGSGTLLNEVAINGYYYYLGSTIGDIDPAPTCLLTSFAVSDRALLDTMLKTISARR